MGDVKRENSFDCLPSKLIARRTSFLSEDSEDENCSRVTKLLLMLCIVPRIWELGTDPSSDKGMLLKLSATHVG